MQLIPDNNQELNLKTSQGKRLLKIALENVKLADEKQQDYGPNNILYSGEMGIAVRCQDKICRLKHLLEKDGKINHESLEDTYRDLANYAMIGLLLHRGQWVDKK
jgi:hypothetical protein